MDDPRPFAALEPDFFYYETHRSIHRLWSDEVARMNGSGEGFTVAILAEALQRNGVLDEVGGVVYLTQLAEEGLSSVKFNVLAGRLQQMATCRRTMEMADELWDAAATVNVRQVAEVLDHMKAEVQRAGSSGKPLFVPLHEFLSEKVETDWLVRNLIPAGGIIVLAGAPKKGKTLAAFELARAVAAGDTAFGYFAAQQGTVVILEHDQRPPVSQSQIRLLNFDQLSKVHIRHERLTVRDINAIRAEVERTEAKLFVIDTLLRFLSIDDENASAKVDAAMHPILQFAAETRCAVLAIHHAKKGSGDGGAGGEELRGSSALYGCVDGRLSLVKIKRDGDCKTAVLEVESKLCAPANWKMRLPTDSLRWEVTGSEEDTSDRDNASGEILEALERIGEGSAQQLADETGKSKRTVQDALSKMGGLVCVIRKEGRTPIYSLREREDSRNRATSLGNCTNARMEDGGAGFSGSPEDLELPPDA